MGTKGNPDKKDVLYGLQVFSELPVSAQHRKSAIMDLIAQVKVGVETGAIPAGAPVAIARYAKPTAASAQANVCRKRDVNGGVSGFTYKTGKVSEDTGETRSALFVMFTPEAPASDNGESEPAQVTSGRRGR